MLRFDLVPVEIVLSIVHYVLHLSSSISDHRAEFKPVAGDGGEDGRAGTINYFVKLAHRSAIC